MTAFEQLKQACGEIDDLSKAASLLSWDQQTYMPPRGAPARGQQLASLSGIIHERVTAPRLGELIEKSKQGELPEDGAAFLRELEFHRERSMKLPGDLVRELAREQSAAFEAWNVAKRDKDFSAFAPHLRKLVELLSRKAECFGYEETPWDALAQDYERGMTAAQVRRYFEPLRQATVHLLDRIRGAKQVRTSFLERRWPAAAQREFSLRVLRDVGFDMASGRLDESAHPFCTGIGHGDVRITTRYNERAPMEAICGVIHEMGHALYDQGFREEDARTPLAEAPSLGIHESQSRFWEVRVARGLPFWRRYFPVLKQYFPGVVDDVAPEEFWVALNKVEPGFTRIEADEVCYNLHIIIRFELEVRILDGTLAVDDIPAEWNRLYKEYLGLTVPDDALGCLQDVHWSYGAFGYFPSYTFGNIYSAMLTGKMEQDIPTMWEQVERGEFAEILGWLRHNIHRQGARLTARELVENVTGKALSADPLIKHLEGKYGGIYGV